MIKINPALSFITVSLLLSFLGQSSSCHKKEAALKDVPLQKEEKLAAGLWGGQHIRMEVTDNGAKIDFDCAHSRVDQPITPDSHGRFEVKSIFVVERNGPQREGANAAGQPVRITGQVNGNTLTLVIKHAETGEDFGTFNLVQGNQGQVMKCR